jgi:nitrite reductase/ring-hydroxylating ferredoxin subunit
VRSVVVARADEIPPGERKIVEIGGRSIGVFNLDGDFYALRNSCPHQGGPLCAGYRFAALSASEPGEYHRDPARQIIRCPWHGWEFEIRTGRSWVDPDRQRVRSYPAGLRQLPEDVEAFPARREGLYVVVDV